MRGNPSFEEKLLRRLSLEKKLALGEDPNTPIPVLLELAKDHPTLVVENPAFELAPLENPAWLTQVVHAKWQAALDWCQQALLELQHDFAEKGFKWFERIPMLLAASRLHQIAKTFPAHSRNAKLAKPLLKKMLRLTTPVRELNPDHNGFFHAELRDHPRREIFSQFLLRGVRCLNVYHDGLSTQFRADWDLTRVVALPDPLHFASPPQALSALKYTYRIQLKTPVPDEQQMLPLLNADKDRMLALVKLVKDTKCFNIRKLITVFNDTSKTVSL